MSLALFKTPRLEGAVGSYWRGLKEARARFARSHADQALCERAFGFGVRLPVLNKKVAKEFIPTAAFDSL